MATSGFGEENEEHRGKHNTAREGKIQHAEHAMFVVDRGLSSKRARNNVAQKAKPFDAAV